MLVQCTINNLAQLTPPQLWALDELNYYFNIDGAAQISIGRPYLVLAIETDLASRLVTYRIMNDASSVPWPYPDFFFKPIDSRLSRYWHWKHQGTGTGPGKLLAAIPEWTENEHFLWELIEEGKHVFLWQNLKEKMALEFPTPDVTEFAQMGEANWVICPSHEDSWQADPRDGITICPKCKRRFLNPLYKLS